MQGGETWGGAPAAGVESGSKEGGRCSSGPPGVKSRDARQHARRQTRIVLQAFSAEGAQLQCTPGRPGPASSRAAAAAGSSGSRAAAAAAAAAGRAGGPPTHSHQVRGQPVAVRPHRVAAAIVVVAQLLVEEVGHVARRLGGRAVVGHGCRLPPFRRRGGGRVAGTLPCTVRAAGSCGRGGLELGALRRGATCLRLLGGLQAGSVSLLDAAGMLSCRCERSGSVRERSPRVERPPVAGAGEHAERTGKSTGLAGS